jgi:hypothetical protein
MFYRFIDVNSPHKRVVSITAETLMEAARLAAAHYMTQKVGLVYTNDEYALATVGEEIDLDYVNPTSAY